MNNQINSSDASRGPLIQEERSISFLDIVDNLFYFRWHFIITFAIITSLATTYAVISTPVFIADALIQVEEKKGTSLGALSQVANALGAQQSPILGEIEILRSRSVVGRAVDNLKANVEVDVFNRLPILGGWLSRTLPRGADGLVKPLWDGSELAWGGETLRIEEIAVPKELLGVPLFLQVGKEQSWTLSDKDNKILVSGQGVQKQTVGLNGTLILEIDTLRARPGTKFRVIVYSIQSRILQILERYTVVETKRQSSILKLAYESTSAPYAAAVINEISDVFLQQNISRRSEEAELSLKFLNEELPKLRVKLDAAEKALNEFRSKSKTMDISSEIKELLAQSTLLEKTQLELDLKSREYAERFDSSHPLMRSLNAQLAGVKTQNNQLARQISQLPLIEQNYIRLARDVQVNNQLYVSLLNNAQQLQIAKAGTTGNVAIIDRAVIPERPARPRKILIVAVGAVIGLLAGLFVAQALALISKIVRDPKRLEYETGLPTLAIIPLDGEQMDQESETFTKPVFLLSKEKPGASSVEALRSLRTSLLFKLSEKDRSKVVLVTSAVPSQGKSFIATNLSYLLAAAGKKIILVEADIRLASIRRYIEFDTTGPGLSTVLKNEIAVDKAILRDVYPNLDYIPSGPKVRNPGDLLAADIMHGVIDQLATIYDVVIIDSPPLLPVHDARSLGKSADVVLFVVRQDAVNMSEVQDAVDVFYKAGNQIDGLVFNGFVPSRIRYGYGYGYAGYRYSGYNRNGRKRNQANGKYGSYGSYGKYGKYGD